MVTNRFASQQGMTAYGTRHHLYDPKLSKDRPPPDQATNKGASQPRLTAPGTKQQILKPGMSMEHRDMFNVSLQIDSNKGASQQGMTVYGPLCQVCDPQNCLMLEHSELGQPAHDHHPHSCCNSAWGPGALTLPSLQGGWLLLLAESSWPHQLPHPAWCPLAPLDLLTGLALRGAV